MRKLSWIKKYGILIIHDIVIYNKIRDTVIIV